MGATKMKLSEIECRTLARLYLGGFDAIRTPEFSATTATINSLIRKGMLGKNGLSDTGRTIAKQLADNGTI
jgi:hypothetical protein